jgi:hypothetical protein
MLLACRLAGLSALEAHYAVIVVVTQSGVLLMIGSRSLMVVGGYPSCRPVKPVLPPNAL